MANIGKIFKEEIERISRKEARKGSEKLRTQLQALKKAVSELKSQVNTLEKENKRLESLENKVLAQQPQEPQDINKFRISAKGIRSLRKKLRLNQTEFAKLVNTSSQSIYNWESKKGTLTLRKATKQAVAQARGMGAREAKKRLEEMG